MIRTYVLGNIRKQIKLYEFIITRDVLRQFSLGEEGAF